MSSGRFLLVKPVDAIFATNSIEEIEEKQLENTGSLIVEVVYPSDPRRARSSHAASRPFLRVFSPEDSV
jgi:hypothetical protein